MRLQSHLDSTPTRVRRELIECDSFESWFIRATLWRSSAQHTAQHSAYLYNAVSRFRELARMLLLASTVFCATYDLARLEATTDERTSRTSG